MVEWLLLKKKTTYIKINYVGLQRPMGLLSLKIMPKSNGLRQSSTVWTFVSAKIWWILGNRGLVVKKKLCKSTHLLYPHVMVRMNALDRERNWRKFKPALITTFYLIHLLIIWYMVHRHNKYIDDDIAQRHKNHIFFSIPSEFCDNFRL